MVAQREHREERDPLSIPHKSARPEEGAASVTRSGRVASVLVLLSVLCVVGAQQECHVVGESGRQAACVELIEFHQLQQVVELGRPVVNREDCPVSEGIHDGVDLCVQRLVATFVGDHVGTWMRSAITDKENSARGKMDC